MAALTEAPVPSTHEIICNASDRNFSRIVQAQSTDEKSLLSYEKYSTAFLKRIHSTLRYRLDRGKNGEATKRVRRGNREIAGCIARLHVIEAELARRMQQLTADVSRPVSAPVSLILYDHIRRCLAFDDATPADQAKPFNVRAFGDWRIWAERLEITLDRDGSAYEKISW